MAPHDMRITFVRHGQADGDPNVDDPDDPPLSDLGRQQAQAVADRLRSVAFDHIYASTMARAAQTADAIRAHHTDTPIESLSELREIDWHMIGRGAPPTDPTSIRHCQKRREELRSFARLLVDRHATDDRVLVVSHGNIGRFLVACLAGVNPSQTVIYETRNASISEVILQDGEFLWLDRTNCTIHLDDGADPILAPG